MCSSDRTAPKKNQQEQDLSWRSNDQTQTLVFDSWDQLTLDFGTKLHLRLNCVDGSGQTSASHSPATQKHDCHHVSRLIGKSNVGWSIQLVFCGLNGQVTSLLRQTFRYGKHWALKVIKFYLWVKVNKCWMINSSSFFPLELVVFSQVRLSWTLLSLRFLTWFWLDLKWERE